MTPNYDSILIAQDSNVINRSELYKTGKGLPDHGIPVAERPYALRHDDYIVGGIALLLFVMAIVVRFFGSTMVTHAKEFFNSKRTYSDSQAADSNHEAYYTFILINISALSFSLIYFDVVTARGLFTSEIGIPYWVIAAAYVAIMFFVYAKAWIYAMINWTFFGREESQKWMSGYILLTAFTAFLMLPLAIAEIMINESRQIVIYGLVFTIFLYELLLFLKMLINFRGKIYSYVLIFLYFCSVELMSTAVMYSAVRWTIDCFIDKLLY